MTDVLVRRLPNVFTVVRLLLTPILVFLLIDPSPLAVQWAIGIFIAGAFTDYLDGFLARRYGAVTNFGKLLDPVADKLLVMAALIMLVGLKGDEFGESWVPAWMVVMVLAREIWVTGLRAVAAGEGRIVAASSSGKLKSALQMCAIVLLMLHSWSVGFVGYKLTGKFLGTQCLLVSIVLSYYGALEYTYEILGGEAPQALDDSSKE